MLRLVAAVALVGLALGPLGGLATAQSTVQLTIQPSEDCADSTYCYELTSGSLLEVSAGDTLEITFENPSSNNLDHNLHLAKAANANSNHEGTAKSQAFANTDDVSPGEEATLTAQVPADASGLYLWCTVGVHESQGMWDEASFSERGPGDGSTSANSSPGPGVVLAITGLAGLALVLRRR